MALSVRFVKGLALPATLVGLLIAPGCVDIVGSDLNRYVERDEKHFSVVRQTGHFPGNVRRID